MTFWLNQIRPRLSALKNTTQKRFDAGAQSLQKRSHSFPSPIQYFIQHHPRLALALAITIPLLPAICALSNILVDLLWLGLFLLVPLAYFTSWLWLLKRKLDRDHLASGSFVFCLLTGFLLFVPFLPHFITLVLTGSPNKPIRRGATLVSDRQLKQILMQRQNTVEIAQLPLLEIADIPLPSELENLGFFFVGSPGSGKTQAIKRLLAILKQRPDFRVMVLDRNGELLEAFYQEHSDLLFNPRDQRSIAWNHRAEGMAPETMAAALVPDDSKDRFFSEAAKSLLADLYERCGSNSEVWDVISRFSIEELRDFLVRGVSARYFGGEVTGSSVLSTLVNEMRFYRTLPNDDGFSFSNWGRSDDPRWLFCSIFEDDAELHKPLYSMAFELVLKGLLSHHDPDTRLMKTAIVIDELGALNSLRSLPRLLSESRKFFGTAILGTQTEAQIDRVYGELERRILLQGTCTKLILNCRDSQTAEGMANLIGKQERVDITHGRSSQGGLLGSVSVSEQIRETHAVMPAELQALPKLQGYLAIADGTPAARVALAAQSYPKQAERFIPPVEPSASSPSTIKDN